MSNIDGFHTPVCRSKGRGWGLLKVPQSLQVSEPNVQHNAHANTENDLPNLDMLDCEGLPNSHVSNASMEQQGVFSSTPFPNSQPPNVVAAMSDIISQVGQQIADSIVTRLNQTHSVETQPVIDSPKHVTTENTSSQMLDLLQSQMSFSRNVKEPPSFRGEMSDTVDLNEWIDIVRDYIKRNNLRKEQQAEEIMVHLRGKARDVVKFGIRNSDVNIMHNPDAIFSILRKHFEAAPCSPLPLADFYTTLPGPDEGAYEYWLRLNRAVDVAADRLKEQGKVLDCPGTEVTRMFIRHCPCKELAITFRSKTMDQWTVQEVHNILNEYHSETSLVAAVRNTASIKIPVNRTEVELPTAALPPTSNVQQSSSLEVSALERVMNLLEKVLLKEANSNEPSRRSKPNVSLPRIKGLNDLPCTVCLSPDHSGLTHCREKKLCFQCHSPDHSRLGCPERVKSLSSHGPGN
ncbi:uncharacterized protein [Danio rerio]|uniref:Uncharacterized protein n=1 Tax=Danio rerio TaxID=7955 RepID=A0AC58I6Y1_DANRE